MARSKAPRVKDFTREQLVSAGVMRDLGGGNFQWEQGGHTDVNEIRKLHREKLKKFVEKVKDSASGPDEYNRDDKGRFAEK